MSDKSVGSGKIHTIKFSKAFLEDILFQCTLPNLSKSSSTSSDKPISRQNDGIQPE